MEDNKQMIPYFVHEGAMARQERTIKRLWILNILLILLLVGTNAGWLYYESQFEDVVTTEETWQDVDTGEGDATVIGIGDYYGEGETSSQEDNENP